jgi:hypothetical protein
MNPSRSIVWSRVKDAFHLSPRKGIANYIVSASSKGRPQTARTTNETQRNILNINKGLIKIRSWDSSDGIVTGYRLDAEVRFPPEIISFFSPQSPDRLWGPSSLLFNGYRGLFPWE